MASYKARILILCKTYPSPSGKHVETSCVAGLSEDGSFIRLFPVPFRLISGEKRFHKWQWITARIEKAPADHPPKAIRFLLIPSIAKHPRYRPKMDGRNGVTL